MCQASTCGRVRARARVQVLQNSGSRMVVLRFTTLSARDRHWRNPRKKKLRAQQYKKRLCQCTDELSATQNGGGAASTQQESNPSRQIHYNSPWPQSHWFVSITRKKRYMTRRISPPATDFFAYKCGVKGNCCVNIGNSTLVICVCIFWSLKMFKSFIVLI